MINNPNFSLLVEPIVSWYKENKRPLPWRENPTPYRVWVSEIMLQQTRIEAVKEYYFRFMQAFPDIYALAKAEEDEVFKLWEGLGYYSRARNMQKAAKQIVQNYHGDFPKTEKELRSLAGIGEYTAGAILSIAFHLPFPAIDGNVLRVVSRFFEDDREISDLKYRTYIKEELKKVYPKNDASAFTQGIMELGEVICKPVSPVCDKCPLKRDCSAYHNATQSFFPKIPQKKEKKSENVFVFLIETEKGISVRKRERGVLKGMYEFPSEIVPLLEKKNDKEIVNRILGEWGVDSFKIEKLKRYSHIFTHIKWEITCYLIKAESTPFEQYTQNEIQEKIALPTAFKQCLSIIE